MKKVLVSLAFFGLVFGLGMIGGRAMAVEPGYGQVILYDNYQCTGDAYITLNAGSYSDFRSLSNSDSGSTENWNDRVSCIKIGDGAKLKVYQNIKYGGKSKEFGRTTNNPNGWWSLAKDWWDNSISSAKVS
jgi:hypothetical protein